MTVVLKQVFLLYIFQFDNGPAGRANHVTRWVFIIIFLFNMRMPAAEVAPFSPFSLVAEHDASAFDVDYRELHAAHT